jgi:mono/diheme cytochrome c family protein
MRRVLPEPFFTQWRSASAVGVLVVSLVAAGAAVGDGPESAERTADGQAFFETRIRPLLHDHCLECHAARAEGGLRLDSRAAILAGGDSGPAAIAGEPAESLLVKAAHYADPALQMPPAGRLTQAQIEAIEEWVRRDLPWPGSEGEAVAFVRHAGFTISDADRARWAYSSLGRPTVPAAEAGQDAAIGAIDAFLGARMAAVGITPNPPATPREQVRRAWFDAVGLPPPLGEVEAFERDPSDAAWEAMVDRLLAMPAFGERQARHWLDVVRYAQTNGYERDDEKPYAWRYRDWVIDAINDDMPYDRFVREQIAGDLLEPRSDSAVIASGFWHLGLWDDEPDDLRLARYDELDDALSTIGQAFLGTTLGCARCHDHKFDPVSQADYYGLVGLIRGVRRYERALLPPKPDAAMFLPIAGGEEWALSARESDGPAEPCHLLIRGNPATPGAAVTPGLPEIFRNAAGLSPEFEGRLALAEWIASPTNPLTARVAANRVWQHLFGRGLVPTPNDFGAAGVPVTHPELLDWLAVELIDRGWSLKSLHRVIMRSRAYRMSSRADRQECLAADEPNILLWRQNRRRLEAEAIRDAFLDVAGSINPATGGRGFFMDVGPDSLAGQSRPGLGWEISPPREQERRSIYGFVKRTLLVPELESLDYTNTTSSVAERSVTTVAPQALLMVNGDFARGRAAVLAGKVAAEATGEGGGVDDETFVRRLFERSLSRRPSSEEAAVAQRYLDRQAAAWNAEPDRIVLRPLVPRALQEGYRKILRPEQIVEVSPAAGWIVGGGVWGGSYEGIVNADPAAGPFALFGGNPSAPPPAGFGPGMEFRDGVVEAELFVRDAAEVVAVVVGGLPAGDPAMQRATGYELVLVPKEGTIDLRRVDADGTRVLATVPHPLRTDAWSRLRLERHGGRLRAWVADDGAPFAETPQLEADDPQSLDRAGKVGLRTLGAGMIARRFVVTPAGGEPVRIDPALPPAAEESRSRARRDLALVVLNLNEFVTID